MSASILAPSVQSFVDYFGALGPRWGLEANACRVHAYLYIEGRPVSGDEIAQALALGKAPVADVLTYLIDYHLIEQVGPTLWQTGGDPWGMLLSALEERRRREIGPALDILRDCQSKALDDSSLDRAVSARIRKLLTLVEDLAAFDTQARRLSPRLVRGIVGISGRAARFADRAFGARKRESHER